MPVAEAPTTSTPPSSSWPGFRYSMGVDIATAAGTEAANAGTFGMLHEPVANTTVGQRHSPWSVTTRYPSSAGWTEVTVVLVWTGAAT